MDDCMLLQEQLRHAGYQVDLKDIDYAWQDHSDSLCAGWLCLLSKGEENVRDILSYLEEIEDNDNDEDYEDEDDEE